MSTDVKDPPVQTAASLVSGILVDLQHLVEQQFQLTRMEIEREFQKRAAAAALFGLGLGVCFLGAVMTSLALAELLHWAASPAGTDPALLPLWTCYAVVAAVLFAVGGVLTLASRAKFKSTEKYHNPMTEILQEHAHGRHP
jgi:hypothetical protein